MTTVFLGVRPPAGPRRRLARAMAELGVADPLPHVTLRAPPGLSPDLAWLGGVRELIEGFPRFEVALDGADTFGDRVLYLHVVSEGAWLLHQLLLEALGPSPDDDGHHGRAFVAHLTLARARGGRSLAPLADSLGALGRGERFLVRSVVVYRREPGDRQYHVALALPLDKAATPIPSRRSAPSGPC